MTDETIIEFPKQSAVVTRQNCRHCGNSLEMWIDDNDNAYGLCNRCDLGVSDNAVRIYFDLDT
jgi:hypothetical protein